MSDVPSDHQAALHGLLRELSDIGRPLVSVTPIAVDEPRTDRPITPATPRGADLRRPRRSTT